METEFPESLSELRGSVPNNREGKDPGGSLLTSIYVPWHTCAYTHDLMEEGQRETDRETEKGETVLEGRRRRHLYC